MRCSPGWSRTGDCLKRIAASTTADAPGARWRRDGLALLRLLERRLLGGRAAAGEAGSPGRVEGGAERVVERAQPDLVAGGDLLAGADEPRARAPLLGVDDRAEDPLERRVEALHERVRVVEAAAVDAHDDLRPRRVERLPLQPLDRLAANLAVQVPGAGTGLEAGERRLVRGPPRQDDEAAAAGGARGAERDRLRGSANDDARGRRRAGARARRRTAAAAPGRARAACSGRAGAARPEARAAARGSRPRGSAAAGRGRTTSRRRRAFGGSRPSASGTVTRVPSRGIPSSRRIAGVAGASSTCV